MKKLKNMILLLVLFGLGCIGKSDRLESIDQIKLGDSIDKLEKILGKADTIFSYHKDVFPKMKCQEDSIYLRFYEGTNIIESDGVRVYTDSKSVLSISIDDW